LGRLSGFEPKSETIPRSKSEPVRGEADSSAALGYLSAFWGVLIATGILRFLSPYLDRGSESLLYLPVVIACALRFGFGPAVLASLFSFCCWDYFFDPPYYRLTISSVHDCISLIIYLAVAVTTAHLAARAKEQARRSAVLDERNRLARDVHDTLSHAFTGIKFLLEAANRIDSPEQTANCIIQARNLAIEGAQEARRSVLALRPAALEEAGNLIDALRKLAEQKNSDGGILITVALHGEQQTISAVIEENLLRICQEAITNALKHSLASRINVNVTFNPVSILVGIEDNGRGFEIASAQSGFGLTSMRERAELIGGKITMASPARGGTKISVRVPLDKEPRK
jgi:signal transduction histidine kinase